MIHDITINNDFTERNNALNINIDNLLSVVSKSNFTEIFLTECELYDRYNSPDKELDEIVLTGDAFRRSMKRYHLDTLEPVRNHCDRCGNEIDIKLWNLSLASNEFALCKNCSDYLDKEFSNDLESDETMFIKPWDFSLNETIYGINYQNRIREVLLWD